MKNTTKKLISLLSLCSDDETQAAKLQLIMSITQSADYSALSKSTALRKPFEELYERSKLEELNNSDLKNREALLQNIVCFSEQLIQCIRFGNAPELTCDDLPDYTSSQSITKVCNTIHISDDVTNFTNISEENVLAVFSDTTVKSAPKCFDMLPLSVTKSNNIDDGAIKKHMKNTLFCVNIEEFKTYHKSFLEFAEKSEAIIAKENFRKRKHRLFKTEILMLCFGAIYACSQFGLFSNTFTPVFSLSILIISLLYLIWG